MKSNTKIKNNKIVPKHCSNDHQQLAHETRRQNLQSRDMSCIEESTL